MNAAFTLCPLWTGRSGIGRMGERGHLPDSDSEIVDWEAFTAARTELGSGFVRILGYFREDGTASVDKIERAMRDEDTIALVIPAHTLKSEARQFGADPLGDIAESIEMTARRSVEMHQFPDELIAEVVELRRLFDETITLFDREMNPLVERRPTGFGRKAANTSFGRG